MVHQRRVLIELYFGKLPVPLNLVRPYLPPVGEISTPYIFL